MVSIPKIEKGIASYLDAEFMPKLPADGLERILTGTVVSLVIKRAGVMLENLKQDKGFLMLGIVDEKSGEIDIESFAEEFKKNMGKNGFKVDLPMIGLINMHKEDIDTLIKHINEQ